MAQRYLLLALSALVLVSCSPCPTQTISVRQWSRQEQRQAAVEIKALPSDSILVPILEDYARLRREAQ